MIILRHTFSALLILWPFLVHAQLFPIQQVSTPPTISGVTLSNGTGFTTPTSPNTTIDTLTATCSAGSCAGAQLALSNSSVAPGCAPAANNNLFAISGSNLNTSATTTINAGTYSIGIAVTIPTATNNGACFPFTLTGTGGGGGTACTGKTDTGRGASLGLTCDATYSDDFNGSSVNTGKWSVHAAGASYQGPCSFNSSLNTIYDNSNVTESGGVLHMNTTLVGSTYHQPGSLNMITPLPNNYYVEISWSGAANSTLDPAVFSFNGNFGADAKNPEVDDEEFGAINFFEWGSSASGFPLLNSWTNLFFNFGNLRDGNWHTLGRRKNNGTYTWWWDNQQVFTYTDPDPPVFTSTSTGDVMITQSYNEFDCPNGALPSETRVNYWHVYH